MKMCCSIGLVLVLSLSGALAQTASPYPDVLYYKFNEGQGTEIVNYAIPGGETFWPTFEMGGLAQWIAGNVGSGALDFAGLDRLLSNAPTDLSRDFTIECQIKTNFTGTGLGRLFGDYSIGLFRCYIGFYNTGANYLGGSLVGTGYPMQASGGNVTDQAWHHIALVYDSNAMLMTSYIDGQVDQIVTAAAPGGIGTNFQLGGVVGAGNPFDGAVDEFRMWSVARTQADIQASMNSELIGNPLQAHIHVNRRSGPSPLLVQFTDESISQDPLGILSWEWDFDDDGIVDSTDQNPCFIYSGPGTGPNGEHTVSLTVYDAVNPLGVTTRLVNYITPGPSQFVLSTCGQGDLYLGAPPPPAGWADGFTLVSSTPGGPVGRGWFFGLYPDSLTWSGLSLPAAPGNPFHFLNVGNPNLFPEATLELPAGSVPGLAGVTLDAVVVYRDAAGNLLSATAVARETF